MPRLFFHATERTKQNGGTRIKAGCRRTSVNEARPSVDYKLLVANDINAFCQALQCVARLAHEHTAGGVNVALEHAAIGLETGNAGADEVGVATSMR